MPTHRNPLVAAIVYDGLCTFEFGIAAEIFALPRPEMGEDWYRFASCAVERGPLYAQGGLTVTADGDIDLLGQADVIIIPGWKGADVPVPAGLTAALSAAHTRGARLVSICSGAFVLAAAGLLDGHTATTHWRYADALRQRFPLVDVDEASLYRIEGRIMTSAGSAAGIDLLIEVVRRDYGAEAANSVARRIVLPAHRSGDQAQFLERPVERHAGSKIGPFLDQLRTRLAETWTIASMARHLGMSERTFLRRFAGATGTAPGDWLASERVEAVKQMLTGTALSMEHIATAAGLGTAHTMRHHFRRRVGISPTEFRTQFTTRAGS